jgi:ATP-dependent RNA helicase HelY
VIKEVPVFKILENLVNDSLLPALIFRTARKQCDADIERLAKSRSAQISKDAQENLVREVEAIALRYAIDIAVLTENPQYHALVTTACGAHHAGQLLAWRLLLEELMSRGLLRLMIATGTVAAGVDFPARTVVVSAHSKRGNDGFTVLAASEFQQMSGRAGRRGKDSVGICLVAPGMYCDARVIHEIAQRPPEPLRSVYFASPSSVLNLLKYRNVDDLRYTVDRSFGSFLDRKSALTMREAAAEESMHVEAESMSSERKKKAQKRVRRMERDAQELQDRQKTALEVSLDGLAKLGYIERGGLTAKGFWAANLCTTLVLELAEAIADRLFDDLRVEELVGIVASIAGDPHRPYYSLAANPLKKDLYKKMNAVLQKVRDGYQSNSSSEIGVVPDAALTVITWMEAKSWNEFASLLRLGGVAEGDVARLITQTADHLNQITRLMDSHPLLAKAAMEGRRHLLRPPISDEFIID